MTKNPHGSLIESDKFFAYFSDLGIVSRYRKVDGGYILENPDRGSNRFLATLSNDNDGRRVFETIRLLYPKAKFLKMNRKLGGRTKEHAYSIPSGMATRFDVYFQKDTFTIQPTWDDNYNLFSEHKNRI